MSMTTNTDHYGTAYISGLPSVDPIALGHMVVGRSRVQRTDLSDGSFIAPVMTLDATGLPIGRPMAASAGSSTIDVRVLGSPPRSRHT